MRPKTRLNSIFLVTAIILGLSTVAAAQMVLDLNGTSGDQGVREEAAKPGEMKTIDLVATKGAKDIVGFEVELAFDSKQVTFKSFSAGGIMAGAMAMPPQTTKDGVKISAALLGKTCKEESGTLGKILIELAKDMGSEVHIKLVKASYGAAGGTKSFSLQEGVKFLSGAAPKTTAPVVTQPPPSPVPSAPVSKPGETPEPPECDETLRNSELKPQAENVPCGKSAGNLIFRTVCNKPPYDQVAITLPEGRMAGCFGVEAITKGKVVWGIRIEGARAIYSSTLGSTVLNRLKLTDKLPSLSGKYTIYLDTRRSDPDARVTVRFVDHPMGGTPATPGTKLPASRPGVSQPTGPPGVPPGQQMPPPPMGPPPSGAVAEDPNEPNVPDGKDFQQMEVAQDGDIVRVQINTYDNWAFTGFQSLYFKGGEKDQVHIRLTGKRFEILGQNPKSRGLFDVKLFAGEAVLEGNQYVLKFPWSDAFGNSPEVEAWLYSQDGRDRIPDGKGTLKVQRGAAPPMGPPTEKPGRGPASTPPGQQMAPPPGAPPMGPPIEKSGRGRASTPPGQQMTPRPGEPPMGPPPDPEEVIKSLPAMLQPIYKQTLDAEKKTAITHMKAELELQESILKTLGATKMLLPRLSDAEKEKIAQALVFFSQRGPEGPGGPPMGPPPGKPGRGSAPTPPGQQMAPQPGGPPTGPPEEMVQRMIDDTQRIIGHIKQELAQMQGGDM